MSSFRFLAQLFIIRPAWPCWPVRLGVLSLLAVLAAGAAPAIAQDDDDPFAGLSFSSRTLCFGMAGITDSRALAVCDALYLRQNVRARELAQRWIAEEPDSPAAHFALAEVLSRVEGNLPRALHHLKRADELMDYSSLGRAMDSGNLEWHYLTWNQLSYVHQLIGNQREALMYLDRIREFYGQDTESFRGWPLIKLKAYDEARESAERVLATSDNSRDRSRAWNTLCAVELADLRPLESLQACENAMSEEEGVNLLEHSTAADTVHLLNASEVSLSLLRFAEAEAYLDRAVLFLNAESVGNPWVYLLYLYMNQSRFDEAREALDNMLVWRDNQSPMITVMNRAEHLMVSAMFLLLNGYPDDADRLTRSALNQPDRTGSYSADEQQKDSVAALLNMMAHRTAYQIKREEISRTGFFQSIPLRFQSVVLRFKAWRSGRHAASLFADRDTLMNRLRPYAPLDVHIPEWVEPELVALMGEGMINGLLEQTREGGAFVLNEGYYHAYRTEIAAGRNQHRQVIEHGNLARDQLPAEEVLLRARLTLRMAQASWRLRDHEAAMSYYETAMRDDPSLIRRLGTSIPASIEAGSDAFSREIADMLRKSPRLRQDERGMRIQISGGDTPGICLRTRDGDALSCTEVALEATGSAVGDNAAADVVAQFHHETFGLGYELSRNQRLALLGNSVIGSTRNAARQQQIQDTFLQLPIAPDAAAPQGTDDQ